MTYFVQYLQKNIFLQYIYGFTPAQKKILQNSTKNEKTQANFKKKGSAYLYRVSVQIMAYLYRVSVQIKA